MSNGETETSTQESPGPVRRFLESLAGFLASKLDLISVELQEEKRRILELLVLAATALLFGALALTLLALVVILVVLTSFGGSLIAALVTVGGIYGLISLVLFARLRRQASLRTKVFEATVEELKKDREWMRRHL